MRWLYSLQSRTLPRVGPWTKKIETCYRSCTVHSLFKSKSIRSLSYLGLLHNTAVTPLHMQVVRDVDAIVTMKKDGLKSLGMLWELQKDGRRTNLTQVQVTEDRQPQIFVEQSFPQFQE